MEREIVNPMMPNWAWYSDLIGSQTPCGPSRIVQMFCPKNWFTILLLIFRL